MNRLQAVFIAVLLLFVLILGIWGVSTNLREKRLREEADRALIENALKAAGLDAGRPRVPIPPVVLEEFREAVRAAVSPAPPQPGKQAQPPEPEDIATALLKAREKAMREMSQRVADPSPYLEEWKAELAKQEQAVLDEVAGGQRSGANASSP